MARDTSFTAILQGRLTKDPEIRFTPNGTGFCQMSVAVNRYIGVDEQGNPKSFEKTITEVIVL